MMYLDHFGLREAPFRITPHTEFFFAGAHRGATLEALIYAATQDEGIVKVSGEVGSGKTMLCRMLLEKLPINVETVYLANPSLSRQEILHAIAAELKAPLPDEQTHLLQKAVQDRLITIHASGRQVVMLIDEAHAMPPETLEEIRLLSNLETSHHKLLHIVLFGQPELDERLGEAGMRQLKERITHNFGLEPLLRNDIGSYLMFRMRAAGYKGPDLFTAGALQLIAKASEGLTRRINILADKALLSAYAEGTHQIDRQQIKAAIHDAQFKPMRESASRLSGRLLVACGVVALAVGAYFAGSHHLGLAPATVAQLTAPAEPVTAPAPAPQASPVPLPAKPLPAPIKPIEVVQPVAIEPSPVMTNEVSSTVQPLPEPPPTAAPTSIEAPPIAPPAVNLPLDTTPVAAIPTSTDLPATFAERLAASEAWLAQAPDDHYFIQLVSTAGGNQSDVERFLDEKTRELDPQQVRVYRSALSGRERWGVIYGDFASREAASAELARLRGSINSGSAYVRSVDKLR